MTAQGRQETLESRQGQWSALSRQRSIDPPCLLLPNLLTSGLGSTCSAEAANRVVGESGCGPTSPFGVPAPNPKVVCALATRSFLRSQMGSCVRLSRFLRAGLNREEMDEGM
jgi:hypothetical protein